jgi:phosphatidylserine decarboxylase
MQELLARLGANENLNFLLTNRIPRQTLTRLFGWFSQIRHPWVSRCSIALWQRFAELHLEEAEQTEFASMHECFIRKLKPGARPIEADPALLSSPCDGIVGAFGQVEEGQLIQAKGFPYSLRDLLHDDALCRHYRNGLYLTIRITSSMYHRFHAPHDCQVDDVTYISGDTWNVNPAALKRVQGLFCKNERAVIQCRLNQGQHRLTLVPVAAVLVASIRLHFADVLLHLKYRGPNRIPCQASLTKGEEMGWFQHGSTIILFAPPGFTPAEGIQSGMPIRMGQALLRLPDANPAQPL